MSRTVNPIPGRERPQPLLIGQTRSAASPGDNIAVCELTATTSRLAALLALTATLSAPAWAAIKTITLSVPGMTCEACPITVKKALSRVAGFQKAEVSFDDAKSNTETMTKATANAGYPSTLKAEKLIAPCLAAVSARYHQYEENSDG